MVSAPAFHITNVQQSKLKDINLENIPFGKYFTDHMLEVDFENGEWKTPEIKPFQPLLISPSISAIHYGQSIFEGIKAYKNPEGKPFIFRPRENYKRFNISAERMQMPVVPEEIFMDGMKTLVHLDSSWIPAMENHSLYIRPFMFGTDELLGVRPSETYKFLIILSPTGPYYHAPMRIWVEEKYVRAVPGGVGFAKAAGNYGLAMHPTAEAKKRGFDQVLWTDAHQHEYVQECGVMNVMFIVDNKVVTPDIEAGTILSGVTRDSALVLLRDMGLSVEERPISIHEIIDLYKSGSLKEVFGTGTAATISLISELKYKDFSMSFDVDTCVRAHALKARLNDIRYGRIPDSHNWMLPV